ncbi:MAG: hypothetical protein N3F09_09420 [Bacteroidia bacterium]|nr:hypothetical protein [Bacteroidia bacterium]
MNNEAANPFVLYRERTINELFSVGFQYVKKYKKSFLIPLVLVSMPLQIIGFYLYMDYYGSMLQNNPFLGGGIGSSLTSLYSRMMLMVLFIFLSHGFLFSLLYNHLSTHTFQSSLQQDYEPAEFIRMSFKTLPKSFLAMIITFLMFLLHMIPFLLLTGLFTLLISLVGNILGGVLVFLLVVAFILLIVPPFFYLFSVSPFAFMIKKKEKGYFEVFQNLYSGIFKNFRKTWLFSFLIIILFYVAQLMVYFPMLFISLSGLFTPVSAGLVETLMKVVITSFSACMNIFFFSVLILKFTFLYGHNDEVLNKHSLKQQIENL